MGKNNLVGRDDRARTRAAFLAASSIPEAHVDHWIGSIPGLLSESKRRRRAAVTQAERISSAGRYWIPRLAPVTALLVTIALIWSAGSHRKATKLIHSGSSLERWLVTGSDSGSVSDPLVNALVETNAAESSQ